MTEGRGIALKVIEDRNCNGRNSFRTSLTPLVRTVISCIRVVVVEQQDAKPWALNERIASIVVRSIICLVGVEETQNGAKYSRRS